MKSKYLWVLVGLVVGIGLGWIMFSSENSHDHDHSVMTSETGDEVTTYTCSMHPQIRQNEPGQCPLCGMDLIPVSETSAGPGVVEMSPEAAILANIQVTEVVAANAEKIIDLQGKVQIDERNVSNQTAHVSGRIEKLFVSFEGEAVHAGQKLATVYSPELISAQKELFETILIRETSPTLYTAARNKLKQWKLSDTQIEAIEKNREIQTEIDVVADKSGVVTERKVAVGDYVKQGAVLFRTVNLKNLWVEFDAYESDLAWIKKGQEIDFTVASMPGESFKRTVSFIDPLIDPKTRSAKVRLEVSHPQLKPEMFVTGQLTASLPLDDGSLVVPKSAIMWTGKRSVAYVSIGSPDGPMFEFRELSLGPDLGHSFVVEEGLAAGEFVVTNGTFKVDGAAQLAGKKSMMNKAGGKVSTGHDHGEMAEPMPDTPSEGLAETKFTVKGNCVMCQTRIQEAATSANGVHHATWNIETKQLKAHFDPDVTSEEKIGKAVARSGHDNDHGRARDTVYNELPGCCKYDR